MNELYHSTSEAVLSGPASHTSSFDSNAVDLKGYHAVDVLVVTGAVSAGSFTVSIEESDDGISNWAAAPADVLLPGAVNANGVIDPINGTPASVVADQANSVYCLGYVCHQKRYIRASLVSASANMTIGVLAVLARPRELPTR